MKNIKIIIFLLVSVFACRAQKNPPTLKPQLPLETNRNNIPDGYYLHDNLSEMDKFVGTWQYTNGNTSLTIRLGKVEESFNGDFYEDALVGDFKYIENGSLIINTLPSFDTNNFQNGDFHIGGNYILTNDATIHPCDTCNLGERRFELYFSDPERRYLYVSIILRYLADQNNPEQIQVRLLSVDGGVLPYEDAPVIPRVPYGTYILNKQ